MMTERKNNIMKNNKLETVMEIMKYIEDLTSKGNYQLFEVALLIADRSNFHHDEITEDLIDDVLKISECRETLFAEELNYDLDDVFTLFEDFAEWEKDNAEKNEATCRDGYEMEIE